jgi:DNA-directed RNA polymerase specialized sigma24 family protein
MEFPVRTNRCSSQRTLLQPLVEGKFANSDGEAARLDDARLAARCRAGEVAAWEKLYAEHHPRLLTFIRRRMGPGRNDPDLVDELAARVWYALVADDGQLLDRYDPNRGARLSTFLHTLAKGVVSAYFRSESRRRRRELVAVEGRPGSHAPDADFDTLLSEFCATLTERGREFMGKHLLAETVSSGASGSDATLAPRSQAADWQLSHRIYRKLLAFLGLGAKS